MTTAAITFQWSVISTYWPFLFAGLKDTLIVSGFSIVGAGALGLIAALARVGPVPPLRWLAGLYVDFFRSTPLFIQLVWLFYAMPIVTGFHFDAITTAVIGLSLYEGSFFTEVFRTGILAVPNGQRESALAQGMTKAQAMRRVILPQAVRLVVPPATSSTVTLIKDSSLVSAIGVSDLMWQANDLASTTMRPFEVITFVAAIYCAMTLPLTIVANVVHRRITGQGAPGLGARGRAALAGFRLRGDLMAP